MTGVNGSIRLENCVSEEPGKRYIRNVFALSAELGVASPIPYTRSFRFRLGRSNLRFTICLGWPIQKKTRCGNTSSMQKDLRWYK